MQILTKNVKEFLTSDINFLNVFGPIVTSFKFILINFSTLYAQLDLASSELLKNEVCSKTI